MTVALADAILAAEHQKSRHQRDREVAPDADLGDLIPPGPDVVFNILKD